MTTFLFVGFLVVAAVVAATAAFTMFFTGTAIDNIWNVKEQDFHELLKHRIVVGVAFATLSVALASAAIGWTRRRRWGWLLSLLILSLNLVGDIAVTLFTGNWANFVGACIEATVLAWLLLPRTRRQFA